MKRTSYAIEQRLRFIDFLLFQYGHINRSALEAYYGISKPQATNDIGDYLKLAPDNARYDLTAKAYMRSEAFKRIWP